MTIAIDCLCWLQDIGNWNVELWRRLWQFQVHGILRPLRIQNNLHLKTDKLRFK